jgi:putative CocE/NonD family hydrolase
MHAIAERGVKVLFQAAWNDFFLLPELTMYEQFRTAGGEGKLVIGPWTHGGEAGMLPYEFQTMRLLWFDRWLKDIDNGMDKGPRVLMNVQGADEWRWEQDWPIPDAKPTRLYLRAEKAGAARSYNDGSLSLSPPDAGEGAATYPYTPTNVAGGGGLLGAQSPQDQRLDESRSLTWSTPPLEQNTELSGPITLRFWGSSTARDADFVARLVDVAPDGAATQMTRGWLKATHHSSDTDPEPLEPGTTYEFRVTVWPNSNVFAAGHRIRLDLSGSDLPLMTPNPNPAVNTVLQDAEHPSYLEVAVIGDALAAAPVAEQPAAAPAPVLDPLAGTPTGRSGVLAATGLSALLTVAACASLVLAASMRRIRRATIEVSARSRPRSSRSTGWRR